MAEARTKPTKRDLLRLSDLSAGEARRILDLAAALKADRTRGRGALAGRAIAIVLEKPSTRTRVSFEVAAAMLGAHPVVLPKAGSQMERGEPVRDTARVLARYCDAIVFRTGAEERLAEMALAPVPVVNALSDEGHPCQALADVFTMEEALARPAKGLRVAFFGDAASNVARSMLEASALFGFELALAAPDDPGLRPPEEALAALGPARRFVTIHAEAREAARGADIVCTDVWASMGQEAEAAQRRARLAGFTVNEALLDHAAPGAKVLHCLPAHRGEEIDEATLEGERSIVWTQAENRLHVQKALLLWLLDPDGAGACAP